MLEHYRTPKAHDVALEPVEVEASAIEEGRRRSFVVLPPVGTAMVGRPVQKRVESSFIPFEPINSFDAYQQEARALMKLRDRYGESPTFLARLSGLFGFIDNSKEAIELASQATKFSKSPVFMYRLGEALLNNNDKLAAREIFENLASDGHIDSLLRLAELSINNQDFDQALTTLNLALARDELDWRVRLLAGTLALARSNYQEAIHHYRVALDDKQNSSVIYLNIGIAYYLMNMPDKALREAKKALKVNPWSRSALVFFADLGLREDRELESAKHYLNQYLSLETADKPLVERLADIYFKTRNFSEGISLLESVKSRFNDAGVWNNLGVFWSIKKSKIAGKYFYQAIESVGGVSQSHGNRAASIAVLNFAHTLLDMKEYQSVEKLIIEFTGTAPDDNYLSDEVLWKFPLYLMQAQMQLDKVGEAIQLAQRLIKNPSLHLEGQIDIASSLVSYHSFISGDLAVALEYAKLGYSLAANLINKNSPRVNLAINNMAFVLLELDRIDEAELYAKELKLAGDLSEYAIATKGLFELKKYRLQAGSELYELAISTAVGEERKNAIRQKMNLEIGRYWLNRGENKKAIKYLKKVTSAKVIRDAWSLEALPRTAKYLLEHIGDGRSPK